MNFHPEIYIIHKIMFVVSNTTFMLQQKRGMPHKCNTHDSSCFLPSKRKFILTNSNTY